MNDKPKKITIGPARPTIQTETFTVGPETLTAEQYASTAQSESNKPQPPDKT